VTEPAGRTRGSRPERAADALGLGGGGHPRLARLPPSVAALLRGTSPVLPAVTQVIAADIPAVAGVPVLEGDVPAGQNQTRPPMYEMGGLAQPRRAKRGQLPGFAGAARPASARYPCEGPVSRLLARSPGSPPRSCPFPAVKAFLLPPRTPRKSLRSIISGFSAIHMVSTEECGYPHLTVVIHRLIHMSSTSYSA
jgi:hypothetical protein